MKLYAVTDEYIDYLRQFDSKVYDNKEDKRKVMRKYLGIVLTINEMNYYTPMSSPKKSDYKDNKIRLAAVELADVIPYTRFSEQKMNCFASEIAGKVICDYTAENGSQYGDYVSSSDTVQIAGSHLYRLSRKHANDYLSHLQQRQNDKRQDLVTAQSFRKACPVFFAEERMPHGDEHDQRNSCEYEKQDD